MAVEARIPLQPLDYFSCIAKVLTRVGDIRLRPLGFATAQLPVLAALQSGNTLSQAELTRLAGVEQPSMAQLLAKMERDGIIRRAPDPADRRSNLVPALNMPDETHSALVDKPDLAAGFIVWLCSGQADWVRGRYLNAQWDIEQLLAMREKILNEDLLVNRLRA